MLFRSLIITRRFGDARSKHKEAPMEILRAPAVGRVCTEDKKVFIVVKAISEWCKENGVTAKALREEMDSAGYMVDANNKYYIGSGTTIPSTQTRCYELKYNKLFDGKALTIVQTGDGVQTQSPIQGTA